ncbi:unnamed protein product, partial [Nezara viridula]
NDTSTTEGVIPFDEDLLEDESLWNLRRWHVILIFLSGFFAIVIGICCCIRFRIPRTKQEIEADYIRKKITMKFKKQLKLIQNSEMDEMDLKKALDRVRTEFKSDTESIAQSEVFSIVSTPRSLSDSPPYSYRKTSEIGENNVFFFFFFFFKYFDRIVKFKSYYIIQIRSKFVLFQA